ncbi:MAG: glycosyltransferase family 4 protein [Candidatus Hodarchaeota archaeon]
MLKVVFIQPGYAHYRKKLFDKLNEGYDILFVFVSGKSVYPSSDEGNKVWKTICLHSEKNSLWLLRLLNLLLLHNFDVVVSSLSHSIQSAIAYLVAKIKRKKFVIWSMSWHRPFEYSYRPKIYRMLRFILAKYILWKANAVIVPGRFSYRYHQQLGISKDRIFVANQSTNDISKDNRSDISRDEIGINQKIIILYLSRIIEYKGLDILVRAFKMLEMERKDVFLLIGGDGDFRPFCEKLARELVIKNIRFLGKIPSHKVGFYYMLSDIFVLPSHITNKAEAWGLVINEAMSVGKPVITTDAVGAAYELVKDGINGYMVKNKNVNELYAALKRILQDNRLMRAMGENSRKIFEEFNDYDKMFEGFKNAIVHVTNE